LIVVVGLAFEARIAAGPGVRVICSGDGRTLAGKLEDAISEFAGGCPGIVSFGVAGGLAPTLQPGTCIIATAIISGSQRMQTDVAWSQRFMQTIPDAVAGTLLGVPAPVAHPDEKRALHQKTGAIAVDMESHIVAAIGARNGVPVAAVRVITDPAKRALPPSAVAAMRPNGTTDIGAMIRSVLSSPREIPALIRTALDARAARATLIRGRKLLDPTFKTSAKANEPVLVKARPKAIAHSSRHA
jgi:adenosylhomocysteine nucleosidase